MFYIKIAIKYHSIHIDLFLHNYMNQQRMLPLRSSSTGRVDPTLGKRERGGGKGSGIRYLVCDSDSICISNDCRGRIILFAFYC